MILIDASVAAKWLLPEAGSEAALDLIAGRELLFAPVLIRIEVLAAITRCARVGIATTGESLQRCEKWLHYLDEGTISLVPEGALLQDAVELALKAKHTLQDCLYLAAARSLEARLVTADRAFVERAKKVYSRVELLEGSNGN